MEPFEIVVFRQRHNPYFNRWFSAIFYRTYKTDYLTGHNPYFNRWFSAILTDQTLKHCIDMSQSLF